MEHQYHPQNWAQCSIGSSSVSSALYQFASVPEDLRQAYGNPAERISSIVSCLHLLKRIKTYRLEGSNLARLS